MISSNDEVETRLANPDVLTRERCLSQTRKIFTMRNQIKTAEEWILLPRDELSPTKLRHRKQTHCLRLPRSNPKHGPGWIAAARLEEVAGKIQQARASPRSLAASPANFGGLVLGCIEAKFCK